MALKDRCKRCGGEGIVIDDEDNDLEYPCPDCDGTGIPEIDFGNVDFIPLSDEEE